MKQRLIHLLTSVVITIVLLEVACRGMIAYRTPEGMLFDKNIIYTGKPGHTLLREHMNDIGCIGSDWKMPKVVNEKRILILGGSTSYSEAYTTQLQQNLASIYPNYIFNVVSCGKPRYTSYINKVNFEQNLVEYNLDAVVVYMGINDAIYNTFPWLTDLPEVGYFNWKSTSKWISYDLFKYYFIEKLIRSKPNFSSEEIRSKAIFKENLSGIIEIAAAHKIQMVLSEFAIASPTEDDYLRNVMQIMEPRMKHFWGAISSTEYAVASHNQVIRELANDFQVPLAKVEGIIPPNSEYFKDICHMTDEGKQLLAEIISKVIPIDSTLIQ